MIAQIQEVWDLEVWDGLDDDLIYNLAHSMPERIK